MSGSEGEIAFIIQGLRGKLRRLSDSDRWTIANMVKKRLKAIKAGIVTDTDANLPLNTILGKKWPIKVSEAKDATKGETVARGGERRQTVMTR